MKIGKMIRRRGISTGWRSCCWALAGLVLLGASFAQAQVCEIPLFVKQSLHGANVMMIADISGSMNFGVYHKSYDPETTYWGMFDSDLTYYVSKTGKRAPDDFNSLWKNGPEVMLVASDNGEDGRYPGNYLNWIYYNSEGEGIDPASIPQVTRIQVLKEVLKEIVDKGSQQLNFGLTVFQNDHGGSIIGKCGVNPTSLKAQIDGLTANTFTPLGETLETVLDYWSYDGPDAAIQSWCQYNFNLLITDGAPTMDTEVSYYLWDHDGDGDDPGDCTSIGAGIPDYYNCSDHMDDVAHYMATEDVRPDLPEAQNVPTYVVGFHEKIQLLKDTAINGDGMFFYCDNAMELYNSLDYAIQDIMRRISSGSAVAVVSTEQGTDDRLYRGKFMPLDWDGYLECYSLPMENGDPAIWEAGYILSQRATSDRRIFTALGGTEYNFSDGSAGTLRPYLGVATDEEAAALINWGRGDDVEGLRYRRGWRLGDIVHSTPVVVGAPSNYTPEESYQSYYVDHKDRRKLVYVGANDGMMHAFDGDSGEEAWAFVPQFALPDFDAMADSGYCHVYTCDQTVTVKDVQIGGVWRTVLVSSGGRGGNSVYALDITYPDSPDVLWQTTVPDGSDFSSKVEITMLGSRAVALIGSGLDEVTGEAWLHGIDVQTGSVLGSLEISDNKTRNKATRPAIVDTDMDGDTDLIYIADLNGSLWRIKTNDSTNSGSWDISELYTGLEPITAPPAAAFGPGGAVYVYFGTGAYLTEDDMMTVDPQYFICVYDHHTGTTASFKSLEDQTDTIHDTTGAAGWYVELNQKVGERVQGKAVILAENVIFTSFAPTLDACAAGGESWLYKMAYDTGGLIDAEDQEDPEDRVESLGQGIASHPVVDMAAEQVVVQSSNAEIHVNDIATDFLRLIIKAWQEGFQSAGTDTSAAEVIQ